MIEQLFGSELGDLSSKSIEELTALQQQCKAYRLECQKAGHRIQMAMETKIAAEEAARKFEQMSPAERDALAQLIAPNGMASNGGVGTPGH